MGWGSAGLPCPASFPRGARCGRSGRRRCPFGGTPGRCRFHRLCGWRALQARRTLHRPRVEAPPCRADSCCAARYESRSALEPPPERAARTILCRRPWTWAYSCSGGYTSTDARMVESQCENTAEGGAAVMHNLSPRHTPVNTLCTVCRRNICARVRSSCIGTVGIDDSERTSQRSRRRSELHTEQPSGPRRRLFTLSGCG